MLLFLLLRYQREMQKDHRDMPKHQQKMKENYNWMAQFNGKKVQCPKV